jgi:hypothetical protein
METGRRVSYVAAFNEKPNRMEITVNQQRTRWLNRSTQLPGEVGVGVPGSNDQGKASGIPTQCRL